jgi:hypothetical protein
MENTSNGAPAQGGYGYAEHVAKESVLVFGLNAGNVRLTKFAHTMNGGKDGAELEALDITFSIDGTEKSYRKFPVAKAYVPGINGQAQTETTDPRHPEFIAAQVQLSSVLVHIIGCFVEKEEIKTALTRPIQSFKEYAEILASLLPANHAEVPLDIFTQWQWSIGGENKMTYLEFPKNMKHGRWIAKSVEPVGGKWVKQAKANASTSEVALRFVDEEGNVHPFTRNGWFMASHFANQQTEAPTQGGSAMQAGSTGASGDW